MRQRSAPTVKGAACVCARAAGLAALSLVACAVAPTAVPPLSVSLPVA